MPTAATMHKLIGRSVTVRTDCGPCQMYVLDARARFGKIDVRVVCLGFEAADAQWVSVDRTNAPKVVAADAR